MINTKHAVALAVIFGGLSHQVQAQDYPYPPVINDLPPRYDILSPGPTGILGFEIGQSREEAHALLEETFPGANIVDVTSYKGMKDDQGNQVIFDYFEVEAASPYIEQTDGTVEVKLNYTTAVTGERLGAITRRETYNKAQPEFQPFVDALLAKYGTPTFTRHDAGNVPGITMYYIWWEGELGIGGVIPGLEYTEEQYAYDTCISIYAGGYDPMHERVNEHPGCTAVMTVVVTQGPQPNLIGSLYMKIDDFQRWYDNGLATDQYLASELQKLTDATVRVDTPAL